MFEAAIRKAAKYTRPVILSRKAISGSCSSSIGAYIVINKEGWIVTAYHIFDQLRLLKEETESTRRFLNGGASGNGNSMNRKERRKVAASNKRPPKELTETFSAWWGIDGVELKQFGGIKDADIGLGKLEPFDPNWIEEYPTFKAPNGDFELGAAVCRVGYPFSQVTPVWDDAARRFRLPAQSVPPPFFASEGIVSRFIEFHIVGPDGKQMQTPFPQVWFETSSPGLRGQSGGPILDVNGVVWGVQSNTVSYPLGFSPDVPGERPGQKEHQFLNVGRGVHAETIVGLLREAGVKCDLVAS